MREFILQEIRRIAKESDGQPPGARRFQRESGFAEHQWRGKFWARWGDALIEAGFVANARTPKSDREVLLDGMIRACRYFKHFPTNSELKLLRQTNSSVPLPNTVAKHCGGRAELVTALRDHIRGRSELQDVADMLPDVAEAVGPSPKTNLSGEGLVYLIKAGEHFKVGRSDNAERRFKQISVSLPEKAELFHAIRTDDPVGIEAYWHRRFESKRANGEWFRLTSIDVAAFKRRKFM